jgi:hypothetical protein
MSHKISSESLCGLQKSLFPPNHVTESLYSQVVFHTSLRLEYLCARLAVLVLNQKFIAINNTYMSVTFFASFFIVSLFFYKLFDSSFVCLTQQLIFLVSFVIQRDSKIWTQFRASIFPEIYMVCE